MGRISYPAAAGSAALPYLVASDNVKKSALTERTTTSTTMVKVKEFRVIQAGIVRISHQTKLNTGGSTTAHSIVYINGVAVGTDHGNSTNAYVTYSDDILVAPGDRVQIYLSVASSSYTAYIKNATMAYDIATVNDPASVITD